MPLDRIVAVLNMDMIGRDEEVPVGGGARFRGLEVQTAQSNHNATNILGTVRSPDLRAAFEAANQGLGVDLRFRYDNNVSNLMRRSDHWPFIQRGVPGVWVHTGLHPDYHTLYDRPEKINYPKMEKIARLVYQTAWDLANASSDGRRLSGPSTTAAGRIGIRDQGSAAFVLSAMSPRVGAAAVAPPVNAPRSRARNAFIAKR